MRNFMRRNVWLLALMVAPVWGEEPPKFPERIPFTSSKVVGTPEPPSPFITERTFANLKFSQPVDLTNAPGTARLFVVEQSGKIFSFSADPEVKQADLTADMQKILPDLSAVYALTFHPEFEKNRFCYVCLIFKANDPKGTRVSRFTMTKSDPPTVDPTSEVPLIEWLGGGHNGCCLKFGPDGYLYISTGDGSGPSPPDGLATGQNLTDLLSCILRIDVDHPGEGKNYSIPTDNPFVDVPGARGEIYAYGFRNPWRMSFAPVTGDLWVGDVGWERWELLFDVEKGGNYGWSVMEGSQTVRTSLERGPTPIQPPIVELPHSEAASITGGLVYRGDRLPELQGDYVYGDWETGKFWAFRYEEGRPVNQRELVDTSLRPVSFSEDNRGEMYILDYGSGGIHRLAVNPKRGEPSNFPTKLSETGLFESVSEQRPSPGMISYQINAEPWEDGLVARRWAAFPGEESAFLHQDGNATFKGPIAYPEQSLFVKTVSLPANGPDQPGRKIETQVLHIFEGFSRGYSYRWNEEQTDAELVDGDGDEIVVHFQRDGREHSLVRRLHSRAECARCHNQWNSFVIGFTPAQLDRQVTFHGEQISQLELFRHWKMFTPEVLEHSQARLVNPYDSTAGTLEQRARSYLDVNCAHCHRMSGGGSTNIELIIEHPLEKTKLVSERPLQGSFGLYHAEIVSPGDPYRSVLFYRLAKTGSGHMPHIGSHEIDSRGLELIHDWIRSIPVPDKPTIAEHASGVEVRQAEDDAVVRLMNSEIPQSEALALIDQVFKSGRGAAKLAFELAKGNSSPATTQAIIERGNAHPEPAIRDLFDRFLPEEQRVARLGTNIRPAQLLAVRGDVGRGRELFHSAKHIACRNCHTIGNEGKEIGPTLSLIGKKYTKEKMLQEILEPSRTIEQKYITYVAELTDGRVVSGLLVSRENGEVVLRNVQGELLKYPDSEIEALTSQPTSLMPESQLRDLQAQEAADLLEYLSSLK